MSISKLKSMYPSLSREEFDYNLWEWTCYPMGTAKKVVKQFRSRMRSVEKKIKVCWFCESRIPGKHRYYCPERRGHEETILL